MFKALDYDHASAKLSSNSRITAGTLYDVNT